MNAAVLNQIWCTSDLGVKVIKLSFHFELSEPPTECLSATVCKGRVLNKLDNSTQKRKCYYGNLNFFVTTKIKPVRILFFRPCWRHFSLFVVPHSLPQTGS